MNWGEGEKSEFFGCASWVLGVGDACYGLPVAPRAAVGCLAPDELRLLRGFLPAQE